jgi:Protein of unknown function (DUF2812)
MLKDSKVKKINKKFNNFTEEEEWLQNMLYEGWMLKSYDSEDIDDCQYIFELVQHDEQKNLIYKIDFRIFNNKDDFQEYKSIFEEAGWTVLAKSKSYSKQIFYTDNQNANRNIFSDTESYKEREKQKMRSIITSLIITLILFIVSVILYSIYDKAAFMGAGTFTLVSSGKFVVDYFKHRNVYKSIV